MSSASKVFVSYSRNNSRDLRLLFTELKRHGIQVWDYNHSGEELRAGSRLDDELFHKIDDADVIIAVVSRSSMATQSSYTHLEVNYSLRANKPVIPLVYVGTPLNAWNGVYSELRQSNRVWIDFCADDRSKYQQAIRRVLETLSRRYRPEVDTDVWLPILDRFEEELEENHINLTLAEFAELALILQEFADRYRHDDWRNARQLIRHFCETSTRMTNGHEFYYPTVVQGICELRQQRYADAEETLHRARRSDKAKSDPDVHGALGRLYYEQRKYQEALEALESGIACCPECRSDSELRMNRSVVLMSMGRTKQLNEVFTYQESHFHEEDYGKVGLLKAVAHSKRGEATLAVDEFSTIDWLNGTDLEVAVIYHARALVDQGKVGRAVNLLQRAGESGRLTDQSRANVYHHAARFLTDIGNAPAALQIYGRKLCTEKVRTRQFLIEYARLLNLEQYHEEATVACRLVLSPEVFGWPSSQEDLYYVGLGYYLLGETSVATAFFEQSDRWGDRYADIVSNTETVPHSAAYV